MTKPDAPEGAPLGPALRASANVRAEIARASANPRLVREAADLSRTTWRRRMDNPGTWRLGELKAIADALGIPIQRLANGPDQ